MVNSRPKFSHVVDRTEISKFRERLDLSCGHSSEVAKSRIGLRKRVICPECSE